MTTWPRFDSQRRERIAETLKSVLPDAKADEIIAELEHCVRFYVPQPGAPEWMSRPYELPPAVRQAAYALLTELQKALRKCDGETWRQRTELLRLSVGGFYELSPSNVRVSLEWYRDAKPEVLRGRKLGFGSEWIDALERLTERPAGRGQPKLPARDDDFRRCVAWVLKDAGMPCRGRGISRTEMVFAEVLAYAHDHGLRPGPTTLPEEAHRTARRDAFKRALGTKGQDPILERRRAEETELLRQSWPTGAAEGTAKRSK